MCGILGLLLQNEALHASSEIYEALNLLQHRGQDAAGIVTSQNGRFYQVKENGMVKDVFGKNQLLSLVGAMGIGHVRYPTAGTSSACEAQPMYVNSPYGIVLAHNGNLTNADELKIFLNTRARRHINTDSDSELLLNVLAHFMQESTSRCEFEEDQLMDAMRNAIDMCRGGFACVAMIAEVGLLAFRDPHGIRPLIFGRRLTATKSYDYMVASESVTLDALGYDVVRDVMPGEAILITKGGVSSRRCISEAVHRPCIFEYVYFARPDSVIDGISVYRARLNMGELLAKNIARQMSVQDIDIIVPVPDTSRTCALKISSVLGVPYREGFVKNRYIGRTFIMPGQSLRREAVRRKLNAMKIEFEGKNVMIVDDSIVRGTTSMEIISMAREAGAKKVYFASSAPPIRYPNVFGIDIPSSQELLAFGRTEHEIAQSIGADRVIYQTLEDLVTACRSLNPAILKFEVSVFNGDYLTDDVTPGYLSLLQVKRSDGKQQRFNGSSPNVPEALGLYNYAIKH